MAPRRDPFTPDLFRDWQPPQVAAQLSGDVPRGGTLNGRISRAVSQALGAAGMSREEIAAQMSDYLGETVSKHMLDGYASQAREDHRITLERLIALVEVTGQTGLLGFVAEQFGLVVVPSRYAELIELHFIDEQRRALDQRSALLAARWRAGK